MKQHTVEITFEAEELSTVIDEYVILTLYRTPDDTYYVYLDGRRSGGNAVLEDGHFPRGLSEHEIRVGWPALWKARSPGPMR